MKNNNKIKKLSILLILYISSTVIAIAQNNSNFQKENRDALKIAFFNSKMDLTEKEALVFWPVANEMEAELENLKNKNAQGRMMLKDKSIDEFSDKELEQVIDTRIQMGKEKVDILVKYHEKFKEVLPIRKLAKFYQASREFKKIQSERKNQHNIPGERKR